ncbi:response regulator, partial [Sulfurimonas sp. SAG-AH-194-L11]
MKNELKILKETAQKYKVLYVEDEEFLRESTANYFKKFFLQVDIAEDGANGLELYKKNSYDLVVTDILMPNLNGIDMLREIKEINYEQETIIISAYSDSSYFSDAIMLDVSGYILKPIDFNQMNRTLLRSVSKLSIKHENEAYKKNLEKMVQKRTREKLLLEGEKYSNFEKTLQSLVDMIEGRDTYTGGHSQRVADYCRLIAKDMGFSHDECILIYRAGILHDIGKITTPDAVLLKPGKLTSLEYKLIKLHVTVSYDLLTDIPMYHDMAEIIRHHHEHYDGSGYPSGLQGDEISILSHIMIVADAFDAMTTNRIYKARMDVPTALKELSVLASKQFHPDVVKVAVESLRNVKPMDSISQIPITEIEQERFAYFYRDQVSLAFNQEYLDFVLVNNTYDKEYNTMCLFFMNNFTQYNEKYGWNRGNELLKSFAQYLKNSFPNAKIFRIHGDDFVLMC